MSKPSSRLRRETRCVIRRATTPARVRRRGLRPRALGPADRPATSSRYDRDTTPRSACRRAPTPDLARRWSAIGLRWRSGSTVSAASKRQELGRCDGAYELRQLQLEPDVAPATGALTAATMWLAEMPNFSSNSSGFPLRGISRTASLVTTWPPAATARATASPDPANRIVIFHGDQRPVSRAAVSSVLNRLAAASRDRSPEC